MSLLRPRSRSSRRQATQAARRVEGRYCQVRPLPSQQEEAMKAMKTLFEYLLRRGASAGAVWDSRWHCSTHRNETSADEARAVCY
jgi:hypothetical protein